MASVATTLPLAALPVGTTARVVRVRERGALGERLMEMGLVPGSTVEMVRHIRVGRLLELQLRGYHLSIRRETAEQIDVELIPSTVRLGGVSSAPRASEG